MIEFSWSRRRTFVSHAMRFLVASALAACLFACSQHYEEGTHPPPRNRSTRIPAGHLPTPQEIGKKSISGTIRIDPSLANRVPANAYLWIIGRERADGGPPLVLQQKRIPRFPHRFNLTQKDVSRMFGEGIVLEEIPEMFLVAKIDQDNRVGTRPGDMEGACTENPISPGARQADITIGTIH